MLGKERGLKMKNKRVEELLGKPGIYEQILSVPKGYRLVKVENNTAYYIKVS